MMAYLEHACNTVLSLSGSANVLLEILGVAVGMVLGGLYSAFYLGIRNSLPERPSKNKAKSKNGEVAADCICDFVGDWYTYNFLRDPIDDLKDSAKNIIKFTTDAFDYVNNFNYGYAASLFSAFMLSIIYCFSIFGILSGCAFFVGQCLFWLLIRPKLDQRRRIFSLLEEIASRSEYYDPKIAKKNIKMLYKPFMQGIKRARGEKSTSSCLGTAVYVLEKCLQSEVSQNQPKNP